MQAKGPKRTVLVTGGSRGIGKAIVTKFATEGYTVWFTYRTGSKEAEELIASLGDCDVKAFHYD